jgi:Terpene cyclase DEP1
MKPKHVYLVLCILGAVIPYWQFIRWLTENGFNASLFVHQLFANRISTFFALDVIISAIVLLRFVVAEGRRTHLKHRWLVVLSVLFVGVSLGLPLFLYLRELQLEQAAGVAESVPA